MRKQQRYVTACPAGCTTRVKTASLVVPEGALLACAECGQLISQKGRHPRNYAIAKAAAELLSVPACLAQRGHYMIA